MWINVDDWRKSLKVKKKKDYPEENVLLQLHEERSLHFLSFDKIKECGCTDRDWRETFILSMFCSNVFISSFRDEKTALNTLNYVASEKTSIEIFCSHTETELPGQAALLALVQLLWELGGGSLHATRWGTACATSCPEGKTGRDGLGKGWMAAQPLCSDLQSQHAMAVGWGKKRSENKSSIERERWHSLSNGPAQLHNKQGCDAKQTTKHLIIFFFPSSFLPKHLKRDRKNFSL